MPKMKTKRSARKRRLGKPTLVSKADESRLKTLVPYL